uniref:ULP_PROTEASE domain-containing protein n=1 Tax=Caenorhabditis japonica TaxID=281687 RepID=A0A8R1DF25_CAEJA
MQVSTSFCTPAVSFKYGSFHDSDVSMREDEPCRMGSFNSQGYYADGAHYLDGSIGEEEESSSCSDDNMDYENAGDEYMKSDVFDLDSELTEDLSEEDGDEDGDDDDKWTNQKRDQNNQYNVAYYAAMEMIRIRFPFQSISIRVSDFCCLQEKDLLNDTLIDFYLNHIVEHVLPDSRGSKVTVLPSIFWHNLSLRQHALDSHDEKLTDEQKMNLKFGDLHDFVADFDLQDFDYIVVPVNEWEHWSLAIVCHPYTPNARIVIFDSQLTADLNNLQNMASLIEEFMKYTYERRTGSAMPFPLQCVLPKRMPQQTNNFDCGIFIAEFARRFLLNPPKNMDNFDFSCEYPDFSTVGKRSEMQRVVLSLSSNRAHWRPLVEFLNGINTAAPHRAL